MTRQPTRTGTVLRALSSGHERALVVVLTAACLAWMFADVMLPRFNEFPLAMLLCVSLLDGASTVLLIFARRRHVEPSTVILTMVCGIATLFAFTNIASYPIGENLSILTARTLQSRTWLMLFEQAFIAAGCGAYGAACLRRHDGPPGKRFTLATWAAGALAYGVAAAIAYGFGDRLPAIIDDTKVLPAISAIGVPVCAAAVAAAALCWRVRRPAPLDRAVALTALTAALSVLLLTISDYRFSLSWYVSRALYIVEASFVLIATVRALLESDEHLQRTENALAETVISSAQRAARIRALWQIATSEGLSDAEHTNATLQIASRHVRFGLPICVCLARLEEGGGVVEAIAIDGEDGVPEWSGAAIALGDRIPLGALAEGLGGSIRTVRWNDLESEHAPLTEALGWRSALGVPLRIGATTYVLTFAASESSRQPFADDDVAFAEVVAAHLTNRFYQKDQLSRIRYQMEHDALTGLKNRTEFRKAVRLAAARNEPFAIAFLDLDRFRDINESEGYLIGDEILVEVGATLEAVDGRDLVARLSGDDFAVVLPGIGSRVDFATRIQLYAQAFHKPFHTGDRDGSRFLPVSCSIGCAEFPTDATDADGLMQLADVALDSAKARGGGATIAYTPSLATAVRERQLARTEMVEGFASDRFFIEYQPTFELNTRMLTGGEALIRWHHPTRGRLMPEEFLPVAERNGLMELLTRRVLGRVIADFRDVELPNGFRCYINLPARLLDDASFVLELEQQLQCVPQLTDHLGIEITETDAMQNIERSIQTLQTIRNLGLRVAIDDFGTGYSSMAYLKRLPIDVIKIDRSFITDLPCDAKDAALAEMFLLLSTQFGLISVAEGIETESQAIWLRDHGCMLGQGYLVARPLPRNEFLAAIDASERRLKVLT